MFRNRMSDRILELERLVLTKQEQIDNLEKQHLEDQMLLEQLRCQYLEEKAKREALEVTMSCVSSIMQTYQEGFVIFIIRIII